MRFLALITLLLIGANSQAATIEIGTPQYVRPVDGQLWYFPGNEHEAPRPAWPGMENNPRDINAPTSKGRLPVTINQKTPVAINRLGQAATNLAKRAGPLGVGLTVAGILCDMHYICPDRDTGTTWEIAELPDLGDYPAETPVISYYCCSLDADTPQHRQPTPELMCKYAEKTWPPPFPYVYVQPNASAPYGGCAYRQNPNQIVQTVARRLACAAGYTFESTVCKKDGNVPTYRPVLPPDWDGPAGDPGLNDPGIIPDLIEGGEPIPLDTPSIDPKTVPGPGGSTTETIRNGQGQPIGTKTTDTTVTITPSGPTTVNVTETTTITETNITNNTTTTTVQETTLPNNEDQTTPEKEPDDAEIDDVQDIDLPEHEIPNTFDYQSWGGGTCPGDPAVTVLGYSLSIPVHTVCTGLSMLRPVVLIMAALASAFIIIGAVRE